MFIQQNSV